MKLNTYLNIIKKTIFLRNVDKILVIRFASIGDVVRSTAVLESLKKKYPRAKIDYLTTKASLPVIKDNKNIYKIYLLEEIDRLKDYDWIINLQAPPPPQSFMNNLTYDEILKKISGIRHKIITGMHFKGDKEIKPTNIFYCFSAIEELFLISLLKYSDKSITRTKIFLDEDKRKKILKKFKIKDSCLGIFLGSNSSGGDDDGFRTYTIEYLEKLISSFNDQFKIVVIGQSKIKTKQEIKKYKSLLKRYPDVIDLVDKTTLEELLYVISSFSLLISSDSSPVHIAMAQKTPVIGLYVNSGSFEISKKLIGDKYAVINSFSPCSKLSWRWKFFCRACLKLHSRMYGCRQKMIKNKIDTIPIEKIKKAADILLNK